MANRPPRNDLERALARMWADSLGVEEVGIDDDFFALGGHSLMAVDLIAQVRALTGIDLVLSDVARAPTVAAMAAAVARTLAAHAGEPTRGDGS